MLGYNTISTVHNCRKFTNHCILFMDLSLGTVLFQRAPNCLNYEEAFALTVFGRYALLKQCGVRTLACVESCGACYLFALNGLSGFPDLLFSMQTVFMRTQRRNFSQLLVPERTDLLSMWFVFNLRIQNLMTDQVSFEVFAYNILATSKKKYKMNLYTHSWSHLFNPLSSPTIFLCPKGKQCRTIACPYLRGICSKTPSGYLILWIVPYYMLCFFPVCTWL